MKVLFASSEAYPYACSGGLADVAEKYVRKGDKLYIEGKIRTTTYEDQTGIRRYRTEILAESMEMLSSRTAALLSASSTIIFCCNSPWMG